MGKLSANQLHCVLLLVAATVSTASTAEPRQLQLSVDCPAGRACDGHTCTTVCLRRYTRACGTTPLRVAHLVMLDFNMPQCASRWSKLSKDVASMTHAFAAAAGLSMSVLEATTYIEDAIERQPLSQRGTERYTGVQGHLNQTGQDRNLLRGGLCGLHIVPGRPHDTPLYCALLTYLSSPKPGHTTGMSCRGARRGGGAGSGKTVRQ